jgi:hypothetical protein
VRWSERIDLAEVCRRRAQDGWIGPKLLCSEFVKSLGGRPKAQGKIARLPPLHVVLAELESAHETSREARGISRQ